jgi:hypothetical protein
MVSATNRELIPISGDNNRLHRNISPVLLPGYDYTGNNEDE